MSKPMQKRALATREKILDGIEELLGDQEFEAISIAQLAATAGVAVGSVYSHFKDKDALLPALLDRQVDRIEARVTEVREKGSLDGVKLNNPERPLSLRETIHKAIVSAHAQVTQSLGLRRALLTYRRLNPDLELPRIERLRREAFEVFYEQLKLARDEIRHEDIREAAKMVNYFLNILFLDRVVFLKPPFDADERPDDAALIENYTAMVYHYLTGK